MPAVNRYYSSVAIDTTLKFAITDPDATTFEVNSTAGFPTSYPYTLALGYDSSNEELVTIIGASGTILTVGVTVAGGASAAGRGVDGTNNQTHTAGEAVKHVISARDMTEAQAHIAAEAGAHGITGTFVGTTDTQTLTNKTITGGTVNPNTLQQGGVPAVTTTGTQTLTNKTLTSPKVNEDVAVTATATELNVLDGITASTAELNILDGVTASAAEINILDGATLSTTELNYVDGVTSAVQTQINTVNTALTNNTPVGAVTMWVTGTAPTGWTLCQGQAISRTTFGSLFSVIGTTYGAGDGSTTFNLPDLRGRVPMGAGQGRNVADSANLPSTRVLGTRVSDAETHTLTTAEIPPVAAPSHVHYHASPISLQSGAAMVLNMSDSNMDNYGGNYEITGTGNIFSTNIGGTSSQTVERWMVTSSASANVGSGGAHNNTQPSTVINFIIKH